MTWIETIDYDNSTGQLRKLYDQCKNPDGSIDNVLQIHSLRPRTLRAHLYLYKAALHSKPNELSYRERELVGTYVSHLNGCNYCVQHHRTGLGRHINDQDLAKRLLDEAIGEQERSELTDREIALLAYARKLTLHPDEMTRDDLDPLKTLGISDAGILDLNQIVAYFSYVNRMVNGLGVEIAGETLGLSPSEDQDGFQHS